jgi:methionyl-tRNA formyltransferase
VLSCGDLGREVANALIDIPEVREVCLVTAPYRRRPLGLVGKVRHVWRTQGPAGFASIAADKVRRAFADGTHADGTHNGTGGSHTGPALTPTVEHLHVADFHEENCRTALRERAPDLGVLAGTYILRPEVFEIPRLGCINLHSGKAPEYRGAAPAFWELYNGEHEVGITVHRVVASLDAGDIIAQETFPLDNAPMEDPMDYIARYRHEVLRPNGVRLVVQAVAAIARGAVSARAQDPSKAATYRTPGHREVRELRRRVGARRGRGAA